MTPKKKKIAVHDPARSVEAARAMFDAIDAAIEERYLRKKQAALARSLRADLEATADRGDDE